MSEVCIDNAFIEEIIDCFLDKYFISGTYALCSLGWCWDLAVPTGILIAVPSLDTPVINDVREILSKRGFGVSFIVEDFSRADYFLDNESGVFFASKLQAYIDAFANRGLWGVDYFETLVSFAGYELVEFVKEPKLAKRYRSLAESQYIDKLQQVLEPPHMLFKLTYEIFGDEKLMKIAKILKPPKEPKRKKIYWEALRATILGNTVAARLGYEQLITKKQR